MAYKDVSRVVEVVHRLGVGRRAIKPEPGVGSDGSLSKSRKLSAMQRSTAPISGDSYGNLPSLTDSLFSRAGQRGIIEMEGRPATFGSGKRPRNHGRNVRVARREKAKEV